MLDYDRNDLREVIDPTKSNNSKECMVCHYWYFNHRFQFRNSIFNSCYDLTMLRVNISYITIITVKGINYRCITHDVTKSEAIHLWLTIVRIYKMQIREINNKNRVYNYYFDNLIKVKKLETKNIFIDEINYMNLVIIYTRHVRKKSIKMLSLHDHESIGKTEENEEKKIWW